MNKNDIIIENLLDLSKTNFSFMFKGLKYPFELLPLIKTIFNKAVQSLDMYEYNRIKDGVYVHKSVTVLKSVYLGKNIIIGKDVDLRNSAFLRDNVIIGDNCVVGNSCELKNVFMFNESQAPHFNYLGDCILGYKAHLGAGVIMSNLKLDKSEISVHCEDADVKTGLKKFSGIVGDYAEIGCNSVVNPGSIIGRNAIVYPLSSVRGIVNEKSIYKNKDNVIRREDL